MSLKNVDYLAIQRERSVALQSKNDKRVLASAIFAAMVISVSSHMSDPGEQNTAVDMDQVSTGKLIREAAPTKSSRLSMQDNARAYMARDDNIFVRREISGWINGHWRIGADLARQVVDLAFHAGKAHGVDPMLVLAVMAKESSFNPQAKSSVGAEGLMQVWRKWHEEKFAGLGFEVTPKQNVMIGTQILKESLERDGWNEVKALQRYNGAMDDVTARYATGVLAVYKSFDRIYQSTMTPALVHKDENIVVSRNGI